MTEHPLTDDVGRAIEEDLDLDWAMQDDEFMCMRAGADWQLEQVIEWLATNLDFACYLTSDGYASDGRDKKDVYVVIQDLKKAMRPEKDGFVEGRNYLANRVAELEKALNELMDVCAECDSWESFPSRPLDKAHSVLNK